MGGVTVREVLQMPALQRGAPSILAGSSGLDRVVRWVHITEDPDIAHLLFGGELLLTIGMGIAQSSVLQERFVNTVADVGIAGLVIELGHGFIELPDSLVEAAQRRGLPLIALHREVAYVEVTESIDRAIISRQQKALARAEETGAELTRLLLAGAEMNEILSYVSGVLHATVVLENPAHQVIDAGGEAPNGIAYLDSWDRHSRFGHAHSGLGMVQRHQRYPECLWADLWIRGRHWGRLHVIGSSEATELIVDRVAASIALALLSDSNAERLVERARSALIAEVMSNQHGTAADFIRRARKLGTDLGSGRLAVLAAELTGELSTSHANAVDPESGEADHLQLYLTVADEIRSAAHERQCSALSGLYGRQVIVVLAVPGERPLSTVLEAVVQTSCERLSRSWDAASVGLVVGASREVTGGSLSVAIEEATSALLFGQRYGLKKRVYNYADLGVHQLLARLAKGPDLALFVESELHALLEHDSHSRQPLLPTLRMFLSQGGRKSEAVRLLGIQRRSLYLRLDRIQQILQRDLEDAFTRTRLTIAIHGLDLLQELNRRKLAT